MSQTAEVFSGEHPDSSRIVIRFDRDTELSVTRTGEGYRINFQPEAPELDLSNVYNLIPRTRIAEIRQDDSEGSLILVSDCDCILDTFEAGPLTVALDLRDTRPGELADRDRSRDSGSDLGDARSETENRAPGTSPDGGQSARPLIPRTLLAGTLPIGTTIEAFSNPRGEPLPASASLPFPILTAPRLPDTRVSPGPPDAGGRAQDRIEGSGGVSAASAPDDAGAGSGEPASATRSQVESADQRQGVADDRPLDRVDLPENGIDVSALAQALRRASEIGLVEMRSRDDEPGRLWSSEEAEVDPFREVDTASASLSGLTSNLNVNLGLGSPENPQETEDAAVPCPPPERFAFLTLATDEDIMADLQAARADLIDEAGAIDPDGALALAERYLAFGFGVEAAQLLEKAELSTIQAATYSSLARIVDEKRDRAPTVWRGKEACESAVALWAVLGQDGDVPPNTVNADAVQRAFFALNSPMRLHLGATLASHLDSLDLEDAAASIRTNLDPLEIASALAGPDDDSGATETGPLVAPGTSERAVQELLERAQSAMNDGRPIPDEDLTLAESLAWEYRGTEEGLKLAGMTALGRLVDNDVPGAMAILEEQWRQADRIWTDTLTNAFTQTVVAKGDAELLELALHPRGGEVTALLDGEQRITVADRLTSIGFPNQALALLEGVDTPADELRRARATAHLSNGDPARALALVAGLEGATAAGIRAGALEKLGQHVLAATAYAATGDKTGAARAAWLSGDPDTIEAYGSDQHRDFAVRLSLGTSQPSGNAREGVRSSDIVAGTEATDMPSEAEPGPLANGTVRNVFGDSLAATPTLREGRDLIARSADLRDDISTLLQSFPE